jgi:hypothetical protein
MTADSWSLRPVVSKSMHGFMKEGAIHTPCDGHETRCEFLLLFEQALPFGLIP